MNPRESKPIQWALKRVVDVGASTFGLTVLAPALALLGVAIRLDSPGGAIFAQERVGRGGRVFRLYKLRTLRSGAPMVLNPDGSTKVGTADARLTRVGRVLRGGLDELPQLWNVLRGDMSLVGPRPEMPMHAALYTDEEERKLAIRPGITSLAAVLGRNDIYWRTRIAIDLRYLEGWSLVLDAKIALQTLLLPLGLRPFDFADELGDLSISPASPERRS